MVAIHAAPALARSQPEAVRVLDGEETPCHHGEETPCHRQPFVGNTYHAQGGGAAQQPPADLAHPAHSVGRVVGSLDVLSGRVLSRANTKRGVWQLCAFLKQGHPA
jgi:hypothetical protein